MLTSSLQQPSNWIRNADRKSRTKRLRRPRFKRPPQPKTWNNTKQRQSLRSKILEVNKMDKTYDLRQWKRQMCNSTDDRDHDPTDKASIIDCIDKHGVIVHSGVNCDRSCPYNE